MCVNATVVGDTVTYEMTPLFLRPPGWMALGFGRRMKDTHMVIMWQNEDDTISLSQRYATGHVEPKPVQSPPRAAKVTSVKSVQWHNPELTTLAFEIPINKTVVAGNNNQTYEELIWAYGLIRPNSSVPDEAKITQHFAAGRLRLDLTKDISSDLLADPSIAQSEVTKPLASHERLVLLHGIGISFGLLVLLPVGALSARLLRTFSSKWLKVHQICNMYIGLPIIVVSWLLGPIAVIKAEAEHFLDAHQICGFIMLFLYLSQVYLGRYIHNRPKKIPHPPSNILHASFGCLLITLAFFQVRSGLNEWETATGRLRPPKVLYSVLSCWALIVLTLYIVGLALLRRQFQQEKDGSWPKSSDYIALSVEGGRSPINATPTHRIFDIGEDLDDGFVETKEADVVPLLRAQK